MNLESLKTPFPPDDIEWRVGRAGYARDGKSIWCMALAYVTNRAIMDRLDEVCGAENWRNEFREWHGQSQLCGISIKIGDEWITKWDGADNTDIESTKGGLSDSMKRAAVQWGIGRYLYGLKEDFATIVEERSSVARRGSFKDKDKKNVSFWWLPPHLPDWALPNGYAQKAATEVQEKAQSQKQSPPPKRETQQTDEGNQSPFATAQHRIRSAFSHPDLDRVVDGLVELNLSAKEMEHCERLIQRQREQMGEPAAV